MTDTPLETAKTPHGMLYEPRGGACLLRGCCPGWFGRRGYLPIGDAT